MPSLSHSKWRSTRAWELDEIGQAHAAVGGTNRGRRYATQQINRAFAVLLASHFQGYCRDLHSESIDHIVAAIAPESLRNVVRKGLADGRQPDRGNAQPGALGTDFGRLGMDFWGALEAHDPRAADWNSQLELLNDWRNAIAHQNFTPAKFGGIITLKLQQVKAWRGTCERLASAMDDVLRQHVQEPTGLLPW
jgi:hypothetical protein